MEQCNAIFIALWKQCNWEENAHCLRTDHWWSGLCLLKANRSLTYLKERGAMATVAIIYCFIAPPMWFLFFLMPNHKIGRFNIRKIDTRKAYAGSTKMGCTMSLHCKDLWSHSAEFFSISSPLPDCSYSVDLNWFLLLAANWIAFSFACANNRVHCWCPNKRIIANGLINVLFRCKWKEMVI